MRIEVEDDYLRRLHDELIDGLICREYQLERPQLTADFFDRAVEHYHSDHYFHHRVDSLTVGIMTIIQKHVA